MQALKYFKDKEMEKVKMELLEINRRIREQVWILFHGMNLAQPYHSSILVCIYLGLFVITEFRNIIFNPCNHVTKKKNKLDLTLLKEINLYTQNIFLFTNLNI